MGIMVGVVLCGAGLLGDEHTLQLDVASPGMSSLNLDPAAYAMQQPSESDFLFVPLLRTEGQLPWWLVVLGRAGGFVAGMWSSALTHELGHALMALGYGRSFSWPVPDPGGDVFLPPWRLNDPQGYDGVPVDERATIASGGFLMSEIATNLLLELDTFPKSDMFVAGFVFYHVLNAVTYVGRDMYDRANNNLPNGGQPQGDIGDLARAGVNQNITYLFLLTSSALALARILEDPDWLRVDFWSESTRPR